MFKKSQLTALLAVLVTQLQAEPSGLKPLPSDVRIPEVNHHPLPVQLIADETDPQRIHVLPTEALVTSLKLIKSPATDCGFVASEMELAKAKRTTSTTTSQQLLLKTEQLEAVESEIKAKNTEIEGLKKKQRELDETSSSSAAARKKALSAISKMRNEQETLEDKIKAEKDPSTLKKAQDRLAALEEEIDKLRRSLLTAKSRGRDRKAKNDTELDLSRAEIESRKLTMKRKELFDAVQELATKTQRSTSSKTTSRSEEEGALATVQLELAPKKYLQAIAEENPNYRFQYVLPATLSVLPELSKSIPLEKPIILSYRWTSDQGAPPSKKIADDGGIGKDIVIFSERELKQRGFSLEGETTLSLQLSTLGYCALAEPKLLANPGDASASLAVAVGYPLHYSLGVKGRYNRAKANEVLNEKSSSPSWDLIDATQKRARTVGDVKEFVEIKMTLPSNRFTESEVSRLQQSIESQIAYFANENYIELGPNMAQNQIPSHQGGRQIPIPSPWELWNGKVSNSLAEKFEGIDREKISKDSNNAWQNIDLASFTALAVQRIAIGDLQPSKK